jgi:hypothetical protein
VLIIAGDPMVAALVGLLLDPDQFDPPEDAIARVRAPLVLVLDCDVDVARSDIFFARLARTRSAIVLFGTPTHREDVAALAEIRGVPWIRLPTDRDALTEAIESAVASAMS